MSFQTFSHMGKKLTKTLITKFHLLEHLNMLY